MHEQLQPCCSFARSDILHHYLFLCKANPQYNPISCQNNWRKLDYKKVTFFYDETIFQFRYDSDFLSHFRRTKQEFHL